MKRIYINIIILVIIILSLLLINTNIFENYFSYKYTAVIVEPREHKALNLVLKNFLENLDNNWAIIIMHGNKNKDYIDNIINNNLQKYKNRITLINLNVDNLTLDNYNNLLVSLDFYEKIPTEIFLIFQTDSIICESDKELINKFLEYDYVGAPWIHHNNKVGNGGLSLRTKSSSIDIINKFIYKGEPEDMFFAFNSSSANIPNSNDAVNFSVETIYSENSFGVHKPWIFLNNDDITKLSNRCKNLDKLIELNK